MGVTADKIKNALERYRDHKNKCKFPADLQLVCISQDEYKNLLRAQTALELMNKDFQISRDGNHYKIESWKMEIITNVMIDTFDKTFEEKMKHCLIVADGKIKILGSAYDEIMRENECEKKDSL